MTFVVIKLSKLTTKIMTVLIIVLFVSVVNSRVSAFTSAYDSVEVGTLSDNASYLNYKIDQQGNRHMIYLTGEDVVAEPSGAAYNDSHQLWYGKVDIASFENDSINPSLSSTSTQLVTSRLVFPYHYNFQIDSSGKVHLVFVSNYTLFYATLIPGGTWTEEQITQPNLWFAYQPDIQLGKDELPRIAYVVSYQLGASAYYQQNIEKNNRAIHYMLNNESGWFNYDITMNNKGFGDLAPYQFLAWYPGFMILNGLIYLAYNHDTPLGVRSDVEFIIFPEFPDDQQRDQTFDEKKFLNIYSAAVRATHFRRPTVLTVNNDIVLLIGTWQAGGGIIAYLENTTVTPQPIDYSMSHQWDVFQVEPDRRSTPMESFTGVVDRDTGTVIAAYSMFHLFNPTEKLFNQDIIQVTFRPANAKINEVLYSRVTDTNQVHLETPMVIINEKGLTEIAFIRYLDNSDGKRSFQIGLRAVDLSIVEGAEIGFLFIILSIGGLVGGLLYLLYKYVPTPEEEEEIMPHLVNLKDSITEH